MSDLAIRVEGLGKRYSLGGRASSAETLKDTLARAAGALLGTRKSNHLGAEESPGDPVKAFWALRGIEFEIGHGEIVGVLGSNGAGKSTLLKILSGITEPTEGRARVKGRVASLLEVGTGFHPELTGRENVFLNGAILGMSRAEMKQKFEEIVAFAEVEKFVDTPVKHFSSGMYLRLAFAVAAHMEPEVLLVDEVLAVGDSIFQRKCLGKMDEVSRQGRTVLFVSHNMSALLALCRRGILLADGRLVMDDRIERAVGEYSAASDETGGFADLTSQTDNDSPTIRFLDISVSQGVAGPTPLVNTDCDFEVTLRYQVLEPVRGVEVSIAVTTSDGQYLFSTTDVDVGADLDRLRMPGTYEARCVLPSVFFRAGRYYLDCGSSRPNVEQLVHLRRIVGFEVLDPNGVETRTGQRRLGVMAPRLMWRTVTGDNRAGPHCESVPASTAR